MSLFRPTNKSDVIRGSHHDWLVMACAHLHLSVSVLVGVAAGLALPAELLQLRLAALDGLGLGPALALVLLQSGLAPRTTETEVRLLQMLLIKVISLQKNE